MKLGLIVESKNDYDALSIIIKKIVNDNEIEIFGAFKDGKTGIIHQKKLLSNKLKNQGCSKVLILRDSDGADTKSLEADIKRAYEGTQIRGIYQIAFAVEELEAWFLSDDDCLIQMYNLPKNTIIKVSNLDTAHNPKEILKEYIRRQSSGGSRYLESDSVEIAKLLNLEVAGAKSISFSVFSDIINSCIP